MTKPVIMFHEINNEIVEFVSNHSSDKTSELYELFNNAEFTFDDALYTQYLYMYHFTFRPCTIFVSSNILCNDIDEQNKSFIKCYDAHELAFKKGDTSHYCTIDQLKELQDSGVRIGAHGHDHIKIPKDISLIWKKDIVKSEVMNAHKFFTENEFIVDSFAYPYNDEVPFMRYYYDIFFQTEMDVYGKERISIESLM